MNFKKISTIALAAASMAMFSCSKSEYAKAKSWVEQHYTHAGKNFTGVGGVEIYDFRKTTTPKCIDKVKQFLSTEYNTTFPEGTYTGELCGYVDLSKEDQSKLPDGAKPYYEELELLNKDTFETILGTEEIFKSLNMTVTYEDDKTMYITYDDTEHFFGDAKIRSAEEFDERGVEIADYYTYDIQTTDGPIKGTITTIFFTENSEN